MSAARAPETHGAWRVLRGLVVGACATALALAAHASAGGHQPSWAVVLAVGVGVSLVGIGLGRFSWTGPRLLALLVGAQLALHPLLNALATAHAGHAHQPGTAGTALTSPPEGWPMWTAHLLAAVATAMLLRHAERLLGSLLDALTLRVLRIVESVELLPDASPPRRVCVAEVRLPRRDDSAAAWSQRGPPR
jgi:hypothetical protein